MDNEQELKEKRNTGRILVNLLKKYPGIWFLSLLIIPIGVVIIAYNQLIYIGYVPQIKQAETPYIPVQSTISTFSDTSNPLPLWLIIAVIFCCSSGSFVIFYLLQNSKESTRTSQLHRNLSPSCQYRTCQRQTRFTISLKTWQYKTFKKMPTWQPSFNYLSYIVAR